MSIVSAERKPCFFSRRRLGACARIAFIASLISSCIGGPPPKLYLLESASTAKLDSTPAGEPTGALGITQVTLPGYASDARVPSRVSDGVIYQLDRQRWADDPEDAVGRLLAERLRQRSGSSVLIEPWPRDYGPVARVELLFDKLYRRGDGGADLSGHVLVLSGDGRRLVESIPFDRQVVGSSSDGVEFFKAVARVIDELAVDVVESLLVVEPAS